MIVWLSAARDISRVVGWSLLASGLAVVGPAASVRAAPSSGDKEQVPICEAKPTLDEAWLITGRDLYARANDHFEAKDYLAAVKAWEQVLQLMPGKQAGLQIPLYNRGSDGVRTALSGAGYAAGEIDWFFSDFFGDIDFIEDVEDSSTTSSERRTLRRVVLAVRSTVL